jgi:hypothetical protein
LSGVYPIEDGKLASRRRPPFKYEIDEISRGVETKARELVTQLREEFKKISVGDGDAN